MKRLIHLTLVAVIFAMLTPAVLLHADETAPASPVAVLPEPGYEFKPVPEGIDVLHDYLIQNKGTATLNIEKVKTG